MDEAAANNRRQAPYAAVLLLGRPIFPILAAVPLVCFTGALLTDITYARSPQMQWANFSAWLIAVGLLFALFAAIIGLIDYFSARRTWRSNIATTHIVLTLAAYLLELFNIFVHSRDAYTSVVPTGLILSAIAVALLIVSGWIGAGLPYRRAIRERP